MNFIHVRKGQKKEAVFSLMIMIFALLFVPKHADSQEKPLILGVYTHGNHFLSDNIMGLASLYFNAPLAAVTQGMSTVDLSVFHLRYLKMKDNGEAIDYEMPNPYGVTAYDLFNDIECGIKLGWQGAESPIGFYLYGAYGFNQYKLRFLGEQNFTKHTLQSWRTGIRVRISPFRPFSDVDEWYPIIELGTTYVSNFKYKGPYGNDKAQINNGMRTYYALGASIADRHTILLCLDMSHYDIFNRNYTPDGGFWYPYANFKNKDMIFSLRYCLSLWEE